MQSHAPSAPPVAGGSAEEAVLLTLMQVGRRLKHRYHDDEIDPAAMPVMHVLRCTGAVRLSDLAARMQLDASTVSRHARALEERGLVERSDDPDDRRAARVRLTAKGEECLTAAIERRRAGIAAVLRTWSDADREQLRTMLTRLVADLSEATDLEQP